MKKIFFSAMLLLSAAPCAAQSYNYLTLRQTSGAEVSLPIEGLKLTFTGGKLQATTNGTAQTAIDLTQMKDMYFAETATGIASVANASAACPAIVGGTLTGVDATKAEVFSLDGKRCKATGLQPGLYVVLHAGRIYKVQAR